MSGRFTYRRVIIGQGAITGSGHTVEIAVRLAAIGSASLKGLFVEEAGLLDLADLPFSTAIKRGSAGPRNLSRTELEQAFLLSARRLRQELAERARRLRIAWDFAALRGDIVSALTSECRSGDVVVLAGFSGGVTAADAVAALRRIPPEAAGVLIAAGQDQRKDGPVVVIDEGGDSGQRIVELGEEIARGLDLSLIVIAHGRRGAGDRPPAGQEILRLEAGSVGEVVRALTRLHPWCVVAGMAGPLFDDDQTARAILSASAAPVLLMRGEPAAPQPS
ncbi:MAG: hypothetical protein BroJett030_00750 [Alphaproteobacteria bacterium]|nr:MAG: hypothetical protein BroJett030_00750 [Alphaproteobacteria bacterium]